MATSKALIALIFMFWALPGMAVEKTTAACGPDEYDQDYVRRSEERYDDFYVRRRALEAWDERRQGAAGDVNQHRLDHYKRMDLAREEYVKNRVKMVEDPELERQWLAAQEKRKAELEFKRLCFEQKRTAAEQLRKRGRVIPQLEEYDLQDY